MTTLLATVPPAENTELTVIMALQLQVGVKVVLTGQHTRPYHELILPVHTFV